MLHLVRVTEPAFGIPEEMATTSDKRIMNTVFRFRCFLFVMIFAGFINIGHSEQFIVEDGKTKAEIVLSAKPARAAEFGAQELQTYLEKISGARVKIVSEPTADALVKIYVGESEHVKRLGITAKGLKRDAFKMVSGANWLALVGNDLEFEPREPWARRHSQWAQEKQAEWEKIAGKPWMNPIGRSLYRDYNKQLDIWNFDHRGSLNAVYAFLRVLGVRWYMPGELGEILPKRTNIVLPKIDRTVTPDWKIRSISRPMISANEIEDALWYLRIGANNQYAVLHHGQRYLTEHPDQRKAHPEYYAMMANGKRDNVSKTANACLSSEGFFREMVAFAKLMFDHYDVPMVSVMPHDGFNHCQCDLCRDRATLERGASGSSSDYVWGFVVRVANELAKTHPDRKVFCGAYSSYRLPPLKIDKLPDNVLVQITNGRPIRELADDVHQEAVELRKAWRTKTSHPLSVTLNYTPFTNRGAYRPQYWPHVIDRGMKESFGETWREDVWLSSGKGGLHYPGMAHLNAWMISGLWWDVDQDVDGLLAEYYMKFYGTAAAEMKAFIEFCEKEYAQLGSDGELASHALELFDKAKAAVPSNSVHGKRIALVDEFLTTLRSRAKQMNEPRPEGLPNYRLIDMGKDKWAKARDTLKMDGKLDEEFWTAYNYPRKLREFRTKGKPKDETLFMARWWNGSLYFGIRCEFDPATPPVIGSKKNNDPAIWQGEHLELLIETNMNSYYQIVVNPAGSVIDLDRGVPLRQRKAYEWSSQAEAGTHMDKDFWSVEIRLPVTSSDEDPLHQMIGDQPFEAKAEALASGTGTSLPWYFNLFRKRSGIKEVETSSFSPLTENAKSFHEPLRFGKIYVR
ncbi:MAG: DUF4838 domain-containing protein [Limisphaerales bacterium]